MAPSTGRRVLPIAIAVTLLLAGCGAWWRYQHRAMQQRLAHERCLQKRSAIAQRLEPIKADQEALATIAAEPYVPTPRPQPPDPALASRYSLLDRQLDEERHAEQVRAWTERERQRRERWLDNQRQRSARVEQQLRRHLAELAALDASLVTGDTVNRQQLNRARRC